MSAAARSHLLGMAFSVALLGLLLWRIGPSEVFAAVVRMPWYSAVAIVAVLALVGVAGGLNLWLLFRRDTDVSLGLLLRSYWTSWMLGLTLPGQGGDVASLAFLLRRHGIDTGKSAGMSVIDKVISLAVIGPVGVLGWWSVTGIRGERWIALTVMLFVLGIGAAWLFSRMPPGGETLVARARGLLRRTSRTVLSYGRAHPGALGVNAAVTAGKLCLTGCSYAIAFASLGHPLPFTTIILLSSAARLVAYLPVSYNGIGTMEAAGIYLFHHEGVSPAAAMAAYVVLRVSLLLVASVPPLVWIRMGTPDGGPGGREDAPVR